MNTLCVELIEHIISFCDDKTSIALTCKLFLNIVLNKDKLIVKNLCCLTAKYNQLDCLKYFYDQGYPSEELCSFAAFNGQLNILKLAHELGCVWDSKTCMKAAIKGNLDCLKYAHEHGCPWDSETCIWAAFAGQIECLKYAHEHGCPWDVKVCSFAAQYGYLDCLKYAHEHGCPWDSNTLVNAAENNHLECFMYAYNHKCKLDCSDKFLIDNAGYGHFVFE